MPRRRTRDSPEQIIRKLRDADAMLADGWAWTRVAPLSLLESTPQITTVLALPSRSTRTITGFLLVPRPVLLVPV
jgi:hypothetical protein